MVPPDPGARPPPIVGTVVLAGVGLIGGSIGLGLQGRFLARRVIGLDADAAALDAALGMGVIDEARLEAGPWLAEADVVVLATPVRSLERLAEEIAPHLRSDAIVTDVGSVKAPLVTALSHLRYVGGHPMAGSERGGVLHADAALLENAVWVLTPTDATDAEALRVVSGLVEALGARPIQVDPTLHDRLVATVSHLPYLAALALTRAVGLDDERDLLALLAAGGFRDLTRVASGSPRMSRDMVVANREAVRAALEVFVAQLHDVAALLDDPEALLDVAEGSKRQRDALPIVRRSLLPARHEVVIAVPDRPGELMRITRALGEADVNIKDIEVLAIREAGGAVRLAFAEHPDLVRGIAALRAAGYEARGRTPNGAGDTSAEPPAAGDPRSARGSGGGGDTHRSALFDLAVERAATYVDRARVHDAHDRGALHRALEVWYLKTRFAPRVPLDGVAEALMTRPADDSASWRWHGGPDGRWTKRHVRRT
ncbi:hypothetical protein BH23DEI1_BH23DEI1_10430 [soil metagenome]